MAKIYEALKQAEKEYQAGVGEIPPATLNITGTESTFRNNFWAGGESYANLKASLLHRYPEIKLRVIMFIAPVAGAGVTTIIANFAAVLAQDIATKVLLVDANARSNGLCKRFNVIHVNDLPSAVEVISPVSKVRPGNLYLSSYGKRGREGRSVFDLQQFTRFLGTVREQFDYVLLDAPPVKQFSEALGLCSQVDGIVLVVEASKTRRQVAVAVKKQVEEAGGRILGVVLNRKKRYIPEFIYKRLF